MIETCRLKLRSWRDEDKPLLHELHSDPEVMSYLGGVKVGPDTNDIVERLMRLSEIREPFFWAVERLNDGAFLGAVGLQRVGTNFPFGPAIEVGWRLARKHWGNGYATEAAGAAIDYAFASLHAPQVYAFTALANYRSEAVMQRLGMRRVEGGEFAHPSFAHTDPSSMHLLYVAERSGTRIDT